MGDTLNIPYKVIFPQKTTILSEKNTIGIILQAT